MRSTRGSGCGTHGTPLAGWGGGPEHRGQRCRFEEPPASLVLRATVECPAPEWQRDAGAQEAQQKAWLPSTNRWFGLASAAALATCKAEAALRAPTGPGRRA